MTPLEKSYSHEDVLYMALLVSPLWLIGNVLYNYSLLLTSISSSTVISNTSGIFTLFFSWWWGLEEVTSGKIVGLLLCFAGVALVTLHDTVGERHLSGDVVAVLGALVYGLYTSILKYKMGDDESVSMQLVLGYVGLVNALLCLPLLLAMIFLHWDNLSGFSGEVFGFVVLSSIFNDVLADYLWARAVLLTSPTVATVGLSMTIPMAILTDLFSGYLHPNDASLQPKEVLSAVALGGASLVIIGFSLVNVGFEGVWSCLFGKEDSELAAAESDDSENNGNGNIDNNQLQSTTSYYGASAIENWSSANEGYR